MISTLGCICAFFTPIRGHAMNTHEMQSPHQSALSDNESATKESCKRSSLVSRNVSINNHRTSIRLEPDMWNGLREICRREHISMHELCSMVAGQKGSNTSLTAAIRVFIMAYFRAASTEDGHSRAGHGPGGPFMNKQRQNVTSAIVPGTSSPFEINARFSAFR